MERLQYDRYGGPELVHLARFTLSAPQPDELIVRVAAASINPMDWKIRNGDMKMFVGSKFPRALGTDFAGTIEAVGSNVSAFKPGDDVIGTASMKNCGAFAPMVTTTQDLLVRKPKNLAFVEAACLPVAGVTAWLSLVKSAQLKHGQRLLINGATGAVGLAAIALATDIGAKITGRVGSRSIEFARSMGSFEVLDYTQPLPASLNANYDVVFDTHGSLSPSDGDRLVKRGGKIIDIVPSGEKFLRALISRKRKVVISKMQAINLQPVVNLAAEGKLRIPVARTISLAQAADLLASLERGNRMNGKVVIEF